MDILQLYEDFDIPIAGVEDRHYQQGWVNTICPFCSGNPGNHLGYNVDNNYYHCFRCGGHRVMETLSELLGINNHEAYQVMKRYGGRIVKTEKPLVRLHTKPHKLPSNTIPLTPVHKKYLSKRGFNPDYLQHKYQLCSTSPISTLDNINYRNRIVIPIYWQGVRASFQTRATKNNVRLKYISCPKSRELIHHKHILYSNWDNAPPSDVGICVEGVTDVWRFGDNAFATFGIQYTYSQLRLISSLFKRVAIVFDDDPQAIRQASNLTYELQFRNVQAWQVPIKGDPASLSQKEANNLIKTILT